MKVRSLCVGVFVNVAGLITSLNFVRRTKTVVVVSKKTNTDYLFTWGKDIILLNIALS